MKAHRSDVQLVSRDDVIALLEDGPHGTGELAEWLAHPTPRVDAALKAMKRDGLVKHVGAARKWALVGYVAPMERPHLAKGATPPARALRQPTDHPSTEKASGDGAGSWWVEHSGVDVDRSRFTTAAAERDVEMSIKSSTWRRTNAAFTP